LQKNRENAGISFALRDFNYWSLIYGGKMKLSKEECRVLACMRAASRAGRRQILWQAEQVVRLEKLLSKREQGIVSLRQCRECGNQIPEQIHSVHYVVS
jgi:hypothetical protein